RDTESFGAGKIVLELSLIATTLDPLFRQLPALSVRTDERFFPPLRPIANGFSRDAFTFHQKVLAELLVQSSVHLFSSFLTRKFHFPSYADHQPTRAQRP